MNETRVGQLDKATASSRRRPESRRVDQGMAKNVTTTTMRRHLRVRLQPEGLDGGVGLQGNKVKRIAAK
jgi:hypothetical protein